MVGRNEQDLINELKPLFDDPGFANAFRFLVEQEASKNGSFERSLFEQLFPEFYDSLEEYEQAEAYQAELDERD
ncbi:hypothetical protein [Leptolyngbya sp. FACHB-711]|uniref:hypothetical protein n=1 Tax=Leptolyngbya sp. FACHB-711 TaxID=2692813 RepID=UPI001686FEA5|nr:hypothetical protein [Leptolyngbya sp. FACHB-711]MBD2025245.1 hypothetical protein [Leptolyngbya sp. FACHB-711]